jgi:hypothetical protein
LLKNAVLQSSKSQRYSDYYGLRKSRVGVKIARPRKKHPLWRVLSRKWKFPGPFWDPVKTERVPKILHLRWERRLKVSMFNTNQRVICTGSISSSILWILGPVEKSLFFDVAPGDPKNERNLAQWRKKTNFGPAWTCWGGGRPSDLDSPIEGDQGEPTGKNLTACWPRWGRRIFCHRKPIEIYAC